MTRACSVAMATVLTTAVVIVLSACQGSGDGAIDQALSGISAEQIRNHVAVLAHDSMRGRDTDDIGYERARDYVAAEFRRIGLEPIDGDSYLQPFDLLELVADRGSELTVGAATYGFPDVFFAPDWLGERPSISAEGVLVGHGLLTGEVEDGSLDGRVAFILSGTPDGRGDEPDIATRKRAEVELALRAGAVAVVELNPSGNEAAWERAARPRRPSRVLADGTSPSPRATARIGPAASRDLLAGWPESGAVGDVAIVRRHELREVRSWNVIGGLPGTDPAKSDEAVVFTAHLDHVGVGPPDANGDTIYNGAHDNALGVAKVLEAAKALAGSDLARSVLFIATGAEESGLLGTWFYVKNPVVPLEMTAAAINHDGGLAAGALTDDLFVWGPEFSTVMADVGWAARETGLVVSDDKVVPFAPSAGLLYRSDHYPFLISGVPVVYLMPGFTVGGDGERGRQAWQDYLASVHHVQADNFDPSASYELPVQLTAFSVRLAWRLANADGMPQTHSDAPIAAQRGAPSGYFFRDP